MMIKWRSGLAGFAGASKKLIKGFFSPSYSLSSVTVDPPDRADGFFSIVTPVGLGVLSKINLTGQSYLSTINASIGLSCIIHDTSKGVLSNVNETGQGVISSES